MKKQWTFAGFLPLLALVLAGAPRIEQTDGRDDPAAFVESRFREFQRLARRNSIWDTPEGMAFVSGAVDVDRVAMTLLAQRWPEMVPVERERFKEALKGSLAKELAKELRKLDRDGNPTLELVEKKVEGRFAQLVYRVSGDKSAKEFTLFLSRSEKGWRATNLKWGGQSLQKRYYSFCKKMLDRYSLEALIAELAGRGYIILEDFEDDEVGKLPRGWRWRDSDNDKPKPYWVIEENGNKFLRAEDTGQSVILGKEVRWDIKKYPYISWRWRIRAIPEGADERFNRSVDSAAGLYLTYGKTLRIIPKSVKFVWSSTLPVGSAMRRSGIGRPWMVVVGSGTEGINQWHTFVYDAIEAYRKTFGGEPDDTTIGIGVLSDANSTHSRAFADYDDIIVFQQQQPTGSIEQILEAE